MPPWPPTPAGARPSLAAIAAACHSGAQHGPARLDMRLRMGWGDVSGVPSRAGLGAVGLGKLGGTISLVAETDLQSIEDIVEKIMAELA